MQGEDRVYCTIINTPDNLVLAGQPQACERVIKKLAVSAMSLNMSNVIHSPPAATSYNAMVELYTLAVSERIQTQMYSSSCYLPVPQFSKAIANSIAKCLCDRVDLPRLINTLHQQGARIFIEMGPGRSLCTWVDKILNANANEHANENANINTTENDDSQLDNAHEKHVAIPVNAKGTSEELTYFRALAKLVSHGVDVDLESLFSGSIVVQKQ